MIELCRWRCRRYWVVGGGGGGGLWWWCGWLGCGMGCDWLAGVVQLILKPKSETKKSQQGLHPVLVYGMHCLSKHRIIVLVQ